MDTQKAHDTQDHYEMRLEAHTGKQQTNKQED
jgi:hypothetical protein